MVMKKDKRNKVYEKYNGQCAYCGTFMYYSDMQVDHIIPIRSGGTNDIDNLNPSCRYCNNYKRTMDIETFRIYLKQMLNDKLHYLFKSKTKMNIAINTGVVKIEQWDGVFHFEAIKKK
jgi:hypothetical protein